MVLKPLKPFKGMGACQRHSFVLFNHFKDLLDLYVLLWSNCTWVKWNTKWVVIRKKKGSGLGFGVCKLKILKRFVFPYALKLPVLLSPTKPNAQGLREPNSQNLRIFRIFSKIKLRPYCTCPNWGDKGEFWSIPCANASGLPVPNREFWSLVGG